MSFNLSEQELGMAMEVVGPLSRLHGIVVDPADLYQIGILAINAGLSKYDPDKSSMPTFMTVVAKNSMIDAIRRELKHHSRRADASLIHDIPTETLEQTVERKLDIRTVRVALNSAKLVPMSKEVLERTYGLNGHDEASRDEIAEECGMSISTVRRKRMAGLSALEQELGNSLFSADATPIDTLDYQSQT